MNASLILCLPLGSLLLTNIQPGWISFADRVGGFAVSIPGTPHTSTQTLNTVAGPVQMHTIFARGEGPSQFGVTYEDLPTLVMQRPSDAALDGAVEGSMRSTHSKMLTCQKISFHGFPGRDYTLEGPQGERYTARIILVKKRKRVYCILATLPRQRVSSQLPERFINSFKLLGAS